MTPAPFRRLSRSVTQLLPATVALVGLLMMPAPGWAQCEVGGKAGSSLLFPYFEVDLSSDAGLTGLISLNNESGSATMTRVIVWTDWGIPVLAFDVYLLPRDVQTMNVRDLLNGVIPSTGTGADLSSFANCDVVPPFHANPALAPLQSSQLKAYLTGVPGPGDALCAGESYGDNHARGYITVDATKACAGIGATSPSVTPLLASYFSTVATTKNVLWGDLLYVDPSENSAQGVEGINLVADASLQAPNTNTFYGRYHSWDGRDRRSPLPTIWTTRFLNGGVFDGGTDLVVWRDTHSNSVVKKTCGLHPSWYPLKSSFVTARDEDTVLALSLGTNNEFPLATQRVPISSVGPGPTALFGRIQVSLEIPPSGLPAGAWVIPIMTASGRFSVDFNGQPLNSGCGLIPTP